MIMTEKRIPWYMHIIFLTKILGIFAVSLNPTIIQNWIKKNASKVPNNLLKSNFEFEGLRENQDDVNCQIWYV